MAAPGQTKFPQHPAGDPAVADVVIVGAGFSGIAMAVELDRAGIGSYVLLERGAAIGGTWRDNAYPGAACDIPSLLYSYSFAPNPAWTRRYAPQREIRAYLEHCVRRFELEDHLRYGREVVAAHWDDAAARWRLRTAAGEEWVARVLVLGHGPLSQPAVPVLDGAAGFAGSMFHSSRWPAGFEPRGLRVGVIGTGASAVQIVPQVAHCASQLAVFQRTPPWILPRDDAPISPARRRRYARWPLLQRLRRAAIYWRHEAQALGFVADRRVLALGEWLARRHLRRQVRDPQLRARLTPDYALGCKRVLLSDDYYPALQQPGVELVTAGIERVTREGIRTIDGRLHRLDVIVLATGFAATEYLARIKVRGRGGALLAAPGGALPAAHLGMAVSGFPNLFLLMGPNTGLAHNSMVFMIEAQARYIRQAVARCIASARGTLALKAEVASRSQLRIERALSGSVWSTGCRSWYLKDGHNPVIWPGFTVEYWLRTRRLRLDDFDPAC